MKICQAHWEALKKEIEDKGMGYLIPKSGQDALSRLKREKKNELTLFDPLMACHNMIVDNAMRWGGLYLLGLDDKGKHYCPLCEVKKHTGSTADEEWITGAVSGCLGYCKENGLLNNN